MKTSCEHHAHHKLDYHYIVDGIYLGATVVSDCALDEELVSQNITADISLEKSAIDSPFGVDFFTWIPVVDHWALSHEQFVLGVSVIRQLVAMERKTYIHCINGHGRSPSLVAAYLITKGMSAQAAQTFLISKRPTISLNKVQNTALIAFEEYWQTKSIPSGG